MKNNKTIDEDISFINRDKRIKHIESTKLLFKIYKKHLKRGVKKIAIILFLLCNM